MALADVPVATAPASATNVNVPLLISVALALPSDELTTCEMPVSIVADACAVEPAASATADTVKVFELPTLAVAPPEPVALCLTASLI